MAKRKVEILDSFPVGSIDREELRRSFVAARERERAAEDRASRRSTAKRKGVEPPRVVRSDGGKVKRAADTAKR